jgi:hypothetical protein
MEDSPAPQVGLLEGTPSFYGNFDVDNDDTLQFEVLTYFFWTPFLSRFTPLACP